MISVIAHWAFVSVIYISQLQYDRDAKSGRYARFICAILSKAVLIFGPCTDRNRNREHCAVRSVLLILWSKHRSGSRVLLTIYEHNNPNLVIIFSQGLCSKRLLKGPLFFATFPFIMLFFVPKESLTLTIIFCRIICTEQWEIYMGRNAFSKHFSLMADYKRKVNLVIIF